MAEFLFLMHGDGGPETLDWDAYIEGLVRAGHFRGGSAIGDGACYRRVSEAAGLSPVTGFIRVEAADLRQAAALLAGNPVFEAGGTVEVRSLPRSD